MQIAPICSGKANIAPRPCSPTAAPNPGHCCSCADKSSTSTGHPRLIAIPICWTFRSVFDTLDNIDKLAADINDAKTSLEAVDRILPQIITQLKLTADDSEALAALLVSTYGQADLQSTATDQTFDDL